MRNVLILDTETTGIEPENSQIIEIGAILYSVEYQTTLAQASTLVHANSNPCEHINRIPSAAVQGADGFVDAIGAMQLAIQKMRREADAYVAHNSEFDKSFLKWDDKPWICTCFDVQWPRATKEGGSLINIALEHGIGVSSAHRALTDCQLIAALFDRVEDLPTLLQQAMRPKGLFTANVSYDDRQLAKDAGFKWDGDQKRWIRRMVVEDTESLPFEVRKLSDA